MTIKDKVLKVAATLAAGSPALALAAPESPGLQVPNAPVTSATGFIDLLNNAINWFFYIIIIVSVIFFLYAGFLYITGGSDSDTQTKAKNMIIYAIIGVAIALLAQAFQYIAVSLTGASVPGL